MLYHSIYWKVWLLNAVGQADFPDFLRTGKWEAQNLEILVLVSDLASYSKTLNQKFSTSEFFIKKYPDKCHGLKQWRTKSPTSRNNVCTNIYDLMKSFTWLYFIFISFVLTSLHRKVDCPLLDVDLTTCLTCSIKHWLTI